MQKNLMQLISSYHSFSIKLIRTTITYITITIMISLQFDVIINSITILSPTILTIEAIHHIFLGLRWFACRFSDFAHSRWEKSISKSLQFWSSFFSLLHGAGRLRMQESSRIALFHKNERGLMNYCIRNGIECVSRLSYNGFVFKIRQLMSTICYCIY